MAGGTNEKRRVVCPHCKKTFTPEPLRSDAGRPVGFKCPHCRLFVAPDRVDPAAAQTQ